MLSERKFAITAAGPRRGNPTLHRCFILKMAVDSSLKSSLPRGEGGSPSTNTLEGGGRVIFSVMFVHPKGDSFESALTLSPPTKDLMVGLALSHQGRWDPTAQFRFIDGKINLESQTSRFELKLTKTSEKFRVLVGFSSGGHRIRKVEVVEGATTCE